VYWPVGLPLRPDPLLIVEGASDAAAAIGLGLPAIGRFSCAHGAYMIRRIAIEQLMASSIVVVSDQGNFHERLGAEALARYLAPYLPVKILHPPARDFREWIAAGATIHDVMFAISVVPIFNEEQ